MYGVVELIVYRFRDKRQKYQHRRLNSYRGDYTLYFYRINQGQKFFFRQEKVRFHFD